MLKLPYFKSIIQEVAELILQDKTLVKLFKLSKYLPEQESEFCVDRKMMLSIYYQLVKNEIEGKISDLTANACIFIKRSTSRSVVYAFPALLTVRFVDYIASGGSIPTWYFGIPLKLLSSNSRRTWLSVWTQAVTSKYKRDLTVMLYFNFQLRRHKQAIELPKPVVKNELTAYEGFTFGRLIFYYVNKKYAKHIVRALNNLLEYLGQQTPIERETTIRLLLKSENFSWSNNDVPYRGEIYAIVPHIQKVKQVNLNIAFNQLLTSRKYVEVKLTGNVEKIIDFLFENAQCIVPFMDMYFANFRIVNTLVYIPRQKILTRIWNINKVDAIVKLVEPDWSKEDLGLLSVPTIIIDGKVELIFDESISFDRSTLAKYRRLIFCQLSKIEKKLKQYFKD